ncbi:hypothetical protein AVEN_247652-1 [Araneus ventricosus]|uniref:Uncharacterized protein n=1 Tax=Araneus ventricosus TaxID=182803 RepID=A0A4Y2RW77_ARAVE|nr:hypothetical protein AVEN_247652-1 [Araneus ventricosus]
MTEQFVILIAIVIPQFPDCVTNKKWQRWSTPIHQRNSVPHQWPSAEALSTGRRSALLWKAALRRDGCAGFAWFPRASHKCGPASLRRPSRKALGALRSSSFGIASLKINC